MAPRAQKSSIPFAPPYVPDTLISLLNRFDPVAYPYKSKEQNNPFIGRKILVLSGGKDTIVPWSASENFVNELEVGEDGVKEVIVEPETGHACTPTMIQAMADFLVRIW
jgi:predicted esterase